MENILIDLGFTIASKEEIKEYFEEFTLPEKNFISKSTHRKDYLLAVTATIIYDKLHIRKEQKKALRGYDKPPMFTVFFGTIKTKEEFEKLMEQTDICLKPTN